MYIDKTFCADSKYQQFTILIELSNNLFHNMIYASSRSFEVFNLRNNPYFIPYLLKDAVYRLSLSLTTLRNWVYSSTDGY
jgi:hypothetical protein